MPDRLSLHAPVLVNMLGHCAGAIVFGILLYFQLIDWRRDPEERSVLPGIAASLALLWNLGSLIGIATVPGDSLADGIIAASFSVLSMLPAVLLHISLGSRWTPLTVGGYVVGALAVALHIIDVVTDAARFHYAAILLITLGFASLAAIALAQELTGVRRDGSGKRLAGAMVLFLLAISFVHFRADHDLKGWSGEAALHHAGIPLALFVILQDYRFLLVDAFVRLLVNAGLAALTVWTALAMQARFVQTAAFRSNPFFLGLEFIAACLLVSLFAYVRGQAQRALTRVVFLRTGADQALARLNATPLAQLSESEFLSRASEIAKETFSARRAGISTEPAPEGADLRHCLPIPDPLKYGNPAWVQAIAPLRFARGDVYFLYLGARLGGRRYLSEDLELLDRMTAIICDRIERMRNSEMQSLVTQAELRALQAQINPHFFFNALNTIYGTIPRQSAMARKLVIGLADLFRISFASERAMIGVEEEVRIVRGYLEIEQQRLGSRLRTEIDVDRDALKGEVPVLSIQPLVENAVKHGVARRPQGGFVSLRIRKQEDGLSVIVSNTGGFHPESDGSRGTGLGLANVRRRLALCFGNGADLDIVSENDLTTVSFSVPAAIAAQTTAR
jgi:two-component system LytT family sensor kinase